MKLVSFESLGAVSHSPCIVTVAVSVAVCVVSYSASKAVTCDLGNWARGRSRSLKMAPSIDHMRLSIGRPLEI